MKNKAIIGFLVFLLVASVLFMSACKNDEEEGEEAVNSTYSIKEGSVSNGGSVLFMPASAEAGTQITLVVQPDTGFQYRENSLTLNYGAVQAIRLGANLIWQFTMPAQDVYIICVFDSVTGGGNNGGGGDPPIGGGQQYSINYNNSVSGGMISGSTQATAGSSITVTAFPWPNFNVSSISANWSGGSLNVNRSGNAGTFTMPAGQVTVSAAFTSTGGGGGDPPIGGSGVRYVLRDGAWGENNDNGIPMYPSEDCLEVWPDGFGVTYDTAVIGGYNGGTVATHFNLAAATSGWAGAAIFFDAGSTGVFANAYDLKFHVRGTGGVARILINSGGWQWQDALQVQTILGSSIGMGSSMNYSDWTEITVPLSGSYQVGAICFIIGDGHVANFYLDNMRFVPKGQ